MLPTKTVYLTLDEARCSIGRAVATAWELRQAGVLRLACI